MGILVFNVKSCTSSEQCQLRISIDSVVTSTIVFIVVVIGFVIAVEILYLVGATALQTSVQNCTRIDLMSQELC